MTEYSDKSDSSANGDQRHSDGVHPDELSQESIARLQQARDTAQDPPTVEQEVELFFAREYLDVSLQNSVPALLQSYQEQVDRGEVFKRNQGEVSALLSTLNDAFSNFTASDRDILQQLLNQEGAFEKFRIQQRTDEEMYGVGAAREKAATPLGYLAFHILNIQSGTGANTAIDIVRCLIDIEKSRSSALPRAVKTRMQRVLPALQEQYVAITADAPFVHATLFSESQSNPRYPGEIEFLHGFFQAYFEISDALIGTGSRLFDFVFAPVPPDWAKEIRGGELSQEHVSSLQLAFLNKCVDVARMQVARYDPESAGFAPTPALVEYMLSDKKRSLNAVSVFDKMLKEAAPLSDLDLYYAFDHLDTVTAVAYTQDSIGEMLDSRQNEILPQVYHHEQSIRPYVLLSVLKAVQKIYQPERFRAMKQDIDQYIDTIELSSYWASASIDKISQQKNAYQEVLRDLADSIFNDKRHLLKE